LKAHRILAILKGEVIDMKKVIGSLLLLTLTIACLTVAADAANKTIHKTIKKVVSPQITPLAPPKTDANQEVLPATPPPPPPAVSDTNLPKESKGIFGWGWNTDVGLNYVSGTGSVFGLRGDVVFADPLKLGAKVGLAEDAVEYKVGLGAGWGNNFKTIPLLADVVLYLKEGSLFGLDPYISAGLNYNLYGTGRVSGGLGGQASLGILADFGFDAGKAGISLGYGNYRVADTYSASGIQLCVSQPLKL
jgi:hypothetical protein